MANILNGNTWYIDATGDLSNSSGRVHSIVVAPTAANFVVIIKEQASGTPTKFQIRNATADTVFLNFQSKPIFFPTGIKIDTLTNAVVTLVWEAK
jgi:hypothetical protein